MRTVAFVFNSILLRARLYVQFFRFCFFATIEIFNSKDLLGFLDYIVSTVRTRNYIYKLNSIRVLGEDWILFR